MNRLQAILLSAVCASLFHLTLPAAAADDATGGAKVVSFYGYDDCILLENKRTRVVLCPAAGGRVLEYALDGENALYLPPGNEGWTYASGKKGGSMDAGRFDIGPEQTIPSHPQLWKGRWQGRITGELSVQLVSARDKPTGVQLIRDFTLASDSTRLQCKQTIKNISEQTKEYCHWCRTFALGQGICVIPLSEPSRFPNGYVMYTPHPVINYLPEDPNIRRRGGFLEILAAPKFPKLGFDSQAGWFAYLMRNDVMFVKRFPTYPDRVYNEVAALTMSIWYPDRAMCELEPIGPREKLAPGESASFTETWWLLPQKFPQQGQMVDLERIAAKVESEAKRLPATLHAADSAKFYDPVEKKIEGWTVAVDPQLLTKEHEETCQKAFAALANHLQRVKYIMPEKRLAQVQELRIWLELDNAELGSMQYHPNRTWLIDHGHDPRLVKHVHIPRARHLYARHMWAKHPYVVLHELAHAYHDQVLGFDDAEIIKVYREAKKNGIYEKVLLYTGKQVRHYGLSNHKEYFAEATEAYFGVNDFYPFVRAELEEHDPALYALMKKIWGDVE